MTNPNKTHITLLCDRSGSMSANRTDAEGGVNAFITEQKNGPGTCTLLLVDFDAPNMVSDDRWFNVVHNGPIAGFGTYRLTPRGNTALLDAMGRAIHMTGDQLRAMKEKDRPGHVFFVVQTDGQENSSRDWKLPFLTETIKQQEQNYDWTFIFLGMGPDAFNQSQMFVGTQMFANTVSGPDRGSTYGTAYAATGMNVNRARAGGQSVAYGGWIDDEGVLTPTEPVIPQK